MTFFLLLGCYDFQGDDGVLWFTSDLALDGKTAWTPDNAVAGGLGPWFGAMARVGDEDSEAPVVWGTSDEAHDAVEPNLLKLHPIRRGDAEVWFEGDAQDGFDVRFRPADRVVLVDPAGRTLDAVRIAPDATVPLRVRVEDRWGRDLGWKVEDLHLEGDAGLSAWPVGGLAHVEGQGGLFLEAAGVEGFVPVSVSEPVATEVRFVAQLDEHCVYEFVATDADGERVYGVTPVFEPGLEDVGEGYAITAPGAGCG